MSSGEIELKLVVAADDLARVARLRSKLGAPAGPMRSIHQVTTYFDTPERTLAAAGIGLRVRKVGDARIQTVKGAGVAAGGLFHRPEWETAIEGDRPRLDLAAEAGLAALAEPGLEDRLTALFRTDIRRRLCRVGGDDWQAELALDHGRVVAGEHSQPINEIELELIKGSPGHLFAAALQIAQHVPVGLTTLTKSDRGHALAEGRVPGPVKAKAIVLKGKQSVGQAFMTIARSCLHQLLANRPALLDSRDPEAIHQMRVALRRLRSALKVFRSALPAACPEPLVAEMRWLLGVLGPARDGDVFLSEILGPVIADHPAERSLAQVERHWREARDRDFKAACEAVADPRYTMLLLRLGHWIETLDWSGSEGERVVAFARRTLNKRLKRLAKAAGRSLLDLSAEQRHQVRILGKQLRYGGDFLASLFAVPSTQVFLSALSELQDHLGELNDIAVAVPRLCAAHQSGRAAWAAGLIAGWHESRRPILLSEAEAAWRRLRKLDPFWR
ncbi:conserved hypothetical protein [Magnetospirillum sp. LM-5]|uniref:CYTH and CHAD domain-containing protein n=1 Tax=Magnetospirillum sp. LM-5 TaxID=2681466 RepID=UPI00137DBB8E|nr:CYTH and CHAD domain-containing protein [Magnetospirillum sp. LM-5]CAA7613796.1 conserved hypothetical protein [Magnetospirillum sp. LM-5]